MTYYDHCWNILLRDAYAQRGLCCTKMSVHPSVTRWYSVEMAKYIKLFSHFGSRTILVFPYQMLWQYSDEDPSNRDAECRGRYEKNLVSEMTQDTDSEILTGTYPTQGCHFQWPWVKYSEMFSDTKQDTDNCSSRGFSATDELLVNCSELFMFVSAWLRVSQSCLLKSHLINSVWSMHIEKWVTWAFFRLCSWHH